jgi:hypothetical protein
VIATIKRKRTRGDFDVNDINAGEARGKTPVHLWIVGVLALLWNAMGAFDYLATQLELDFYMSQFTPEQLEYFYSFPKLMTACWAFAIWGAVAGSIGLLMRKKWAVWAFVVACTGMLFTTIYNYGMTNGAEIMGSTGVIFSVVIWVIALFLLYYSWSQAKKGVLV